MKLALYVGIALVCVSLAAALPVPHGIQGTVYDLDGITQSAPARITITNTNTNYTLAFMSGRGELSGAYAAVVPGTDGDTIIVSASNTYHTTQRSIELAGVMRGVDLLLNQSAGPQPPNITSTPVLTALEDTPYVYMVEASDANNDPLTYSLIHAPSSMNISSSVVTWTPQQSDVGNHTIQISVSDGSYAAVQTYTLEVLNTDDAPEFITTPPLHAQTHELYVYDAHATDTDGVVNYTLLVAPKHMTVNNETGTIEWTPRPPDVGNRSVVLLARSDGASAHQFWAISVEAALPPPAQAAPGKNKNTLHSGNLHIELHYTQQLPPIVYVIPFNQRPPGTIPLGKRAHTYFEIRSADEFERAELTYSVPAQWLASQQLSILDLAIYHLNGQHWEELPTAANGNDLHASTTSFSYFAVAVRKEHALDDIYASRNTSNTALPEVQPVSGLVTKNNKTQEKEVRVTNMRTNETTTLDTKNGVYAGLVPGRANDKVEVEVGSQKTNVRLQDLNGALISEDNGLTISRLPSSLFIQSERSVPWYLLLLVPLGLLIWVKRRG